MVQKHGHGLKKHHFFFSQISKNTQKQSLPYFSLSLANTQMERNSCIPTSNGSKHEECRSISWKECINKRIACINIQLV